jgi:hypothetical protein
MIKDIIDSIRKNFSLISATLLVPISGAWFTYWERDHSDRSFLRTLYEKETEQHQAFVEDVSSRLLKGEFEYLRLYAIDDANNFREVVESEANRLGKDPADIENFSIMPPQRPVPDLAYSAALSDVFGAKLNLLLGSSRARQQFSPSALVSSGNLARETLHFLRRSGLLDYGGLLMEGDLSDLDLRDSNLACTYLFRLKLSKTDLSGANLIGAYLNTAEMAASANFANARLLFSQLTGSWFVDSDFSDSNMQYASLRNATLRDSDFSRADLRSALLYGARLQGENSFDGADLRGSVLLFDQLNSAKGMIFKGAFANSKPFKLDDGTVIPPTTLPSGLSFDELGLIDVNPGNSMLLKAAGTRDGEEVKTINLPSTCKWKVDGALALVSLYRS